MSGHTPTWATANLEQTSIRLKARLLPNISQTARLSSRIFSRPAGSGMNDWRSAFNGIIYNHRVPDYLNGYSRPAHQKAPKEEAAHGF